MSEEPREVKEPRPSPTMYPKVKKGRVYMQDLPVSPSNNNAFNLPLNSISSLNIHGQLFSVSFNCSREYLKVI